jgi:hypothetical protein
MRRLLVLALLLLGVSGCGVLDDEGPALSQPLDPSKYGAPTAVPGFQPEVPIPKLVPPRGAVAKALDSGAIGVVDLGGVVQIEPDTLDTASDITLVALRWTSWDRSGAHGEGTLRMPNCQPTCATGGVDELPARVELSGVKTCSGRRYFDHGEVRLDAHDPPATYVRAPC